MKIVLILGLVLLILSACIPVQNVTKIPSPISVTIRPIIPTATVIPTVIHTSTPTATIAPVPTLLKEDAYQLLASLLKNNDGCELPCWWGLVPGKSAPIDVYTKLIAFSNIANVDYLRPIGGVLYLTYPENDLSVYINVGSQPNADKNRIEIIEISTQVLRKVEEGSYQSVRGAAAYDELLGAYSLSNILSKHGHPSQVLVRADIYDYSSNPDTFEITLLYPEQGIFVRYNTLGEREGDTISGCPAKAFVDLWLLSPDAKDSYQEILLSMDDLWEGHWPYSKPVDEAAEMTRDEFYKAFEQPTSRCLETPLSIWPGH